MGPELSLELIVDFFERARNYLQKSCADFFE